MREQRESREKAEKGQNGVVFSVFPFQGKDGRALVMSIYPDMFERPRRRQKASE